MSHFLPVPFARCVAFRASAVVAAIAISAGLGAPASRLDAQVTQRLSIDSAQLLADISALAADSMEGRRIGTPGGARARAFLVRAMSRAGLTPLADSFPRAFAIRTRAGANVAGVNLVGVVRGTRVPDRFIVVSAHYDHLGVRNEQIYNGADDNASGTAGVLALARWYRAHPTGHSLLFVLFDGEEAGELGSKAFVENPPVPLTAIAADVNLDMVSRNVKGELYATGAAVTPWFRPLLDSAAATARVKLLLGHDTGTGQDNWIHQSDQGSFADKNVPFVYFGVEDHPDYHRATDDVERIDPAFYLRAVETVGDFIWRLDRALEKRADASPARVRSKY